jgi:hypothetical protein
MYVYLDLNSHVFKLELYSKMNANGREKRRDKIRERERYKEQIYR